MSSGSDLNSVFFVGSLKRSEKIWCHPRLLDFVANRCSSLESSPFVIDTSVSPTGSHSLCCLVVFYQFFQRLKLPSNIAV